MESNRSETGVPSADVAEQAHSASSVKNQPPARHKGSGLMGAFQPNHILSPGAARIVIASEIVIALLVWLNSPFEVLPRPMEVVRALQDLWLTQGLGPELTISFKMNVEALVISSICSTLLAYLTVLPVFRPIVNALSKCRFLSLVGFTFVFTLMVGGGHPLKIALLVFGMTVYFVTSMATVVTSIPKETFDHARTLRMNEWQVVWEVVILGTFDQAFETMRQNAAIGWMMLTMVEGIARSEGGIGVMLLNESKHFLLPEVFAIQLVILTLGLFQDYFIGIVRQVICPYANLSLERGDI